MADKLIITPQEVRGYGNIKETVKDVKELRNKDSYIVLSQSVVDNIQLGIIRMIYQDPNRLFYFNMNSKYLTYNSETGELTFASKALQLDEDDLELSFDEKTLIVDVPPAPTYLFFDDASVDRTSDYTLEDSSCSLTYNNDGYYVLTKKNISGTSGIKINTATFPKNIKITVDVCMTTSGNTQPKILLKNPSSAFGYVARTTYTNQKASIILGTYTSEGPSLTGDVSFSQSLNTFYTFEFIHNDGDLEFNIYQGETLLKTLTVTGIVLTIADTGNEIGVCVSYENDKSFRFKNLKVEAL